VALSLGARQRELDNRREKAVGQLAAFERQVHDAELPLSSDDPEQIQHGVPLGLAALRLFGVLDDPDWSHRSPAADLPPGDRIRLNRDVGELAFLLARAKLFQEGAKDPDQARLLHNLAAAYLGPEARPLLSVQEAHLTGTDAATETYLRLREQLQAGQVGVGRLSFLVACEHSTHGHLRESLQHLDQLVRVAPTRFNAWFFKGRCHDALSQIDEAITCYTACIALRPDDPRGYLARAGIIHNNGRDRNLALADLNTALRLDPNRQIARIDRALVLMDMGRNREALADLDKVLAGPQALTRVYAFRATVRERLGDLQGAEEDRAKFNKLEPTDVRSWNVRGQLRAPSDPVGALADFRQAEKLNPRSRDALDNQAYILGEVQKKYQEALAVQDRLVKYHPEYLVGRSSRGVLLARLGRTTEAVAEARACLAASLKAEVQYRLACIYALASVAGRPDGKGDPDLLRESQRQLASALVGGWGYEYILDDDDLAPLRKQTGFGSLLEVVRMLKTWQK
jgi:tetratricopeptide (TPR) repeat protein